MKWITSLGEFLYEVSSWLLFAPLTLWRCITGPLTMMEYAERQLALPPEDQFSGAINPPLLLAIALMLAHVAAASMGEADALVTSRTGFSALIKDDSTALVVRLLIFASFPTFAAARFVRRSGAKIDRTTMRHPFYAQCYPTAVLALGLGVGTSLATSMKHPAVIAGQALIAATLLHYIFVEMRWYAHKLGISRLRALGAVMMGLFEAMVVFVLVGCLLLL